MSTLVRFLRSLPPYLGGETAGFTEDQALAFVEAGVAELLSDAEVKALRAPKKAAKAAAALADLVLVRFRKREREDDPKVPPPYIGGETAGFSPEVAAHLVEAGVADIVDKASPAVAPSGAGPEPGKPVKVVFVSSAHGYMKGEAATFPEAEAKALIKAGIAVLPGDAPQKPAPLTAGDDVDVLGRTDAKGLEPVK